MGGFAPGIGADLYHAGHGALVDRLLRHSATTVAFLPEEPDEILGWVCTDGFILHYVYVKQAYRRRDVATKLLRADVMRFCTHETRAGRAFVSKFGLRFNPYLLFNPLYVE